jgi:hypothetical protein
MSKPDATGESLESILASIRRSLAEQSTGVLEDDPGPATLLPPDEGTADDADVPRLFGGSGAGAAPAPAAERESQTRLDDDPPPPASTLAAPVQEAPHPAAGATPATLDDPPPPASATSPQPAQPAQKDAGRDPFWFLSGRGEAARKDSATPAAAPDAPRPAASAASKVAAPEPKPARSEVVRGPLPPFFGSSAEAAKVEVAPAPAAAPAPSVVPPPGPAPAPTPAQAPDVVPPRGVQAEAPRTPAWPPAPSGQPASALPPLFTAPTQQQPAPSPVPPAAREGLANGRAAFLAPPQPAAAAGPGIAPGGATGPSGADALPHVRGLEAMVAELLRPMLRRWLDENMPRLVSAALKAEADVMSGRDSKKP